MRDIRTICGEKSKHVEWIFWATLGFLVALGILLAVVSIGDPKVILVEYYWIFSALQISALATLGGFALFAGCVNAQITSAIEKPASHVIDLGVSITTLLFFVSFPIIQARLNNISNAR